MDQADPNSVRTYSEQMIRNTGSEGRAGGKRKRESDDDYQVYNYYSQNGSAAGRTVCHNNSSVMNNTNVTGKTPAPTINNNNIHQTATTHDTPAVSKRQAGEGVSWWTCLQYDMPLSKTKPQVVARNESHKTTPFW